MKNKKLRLPAMILAAAIFVTVVFSAVQKKKKKPAVTEGAFPFSITYELDGETVTINEVYKARYVKNGGYADTKSRVYTGEIGDLGEDNTVYTLKKDANTRIELWTYFYPDYLMGDPTYDYFDGEAFEPRIYYFDAEENAYHDEKTLAEQGVKLVDFAYPIPIENTLVFSHMSYFSNAIVLPTLLIALLALIATIVFVRKDCKYKAVDIVSIVLSGVIGSVYLAFVTIFAMLIDIEGGGPEFSHQALYFLPAFSLLCITASVALRRKGYGVAALIAELVGPAAFAVYWLICSVAGLL